MVGQVVKGPPRPVLRFLGLLALLLPPRNHALRRRPQAQSGRSDLNTRPPGPQPGALPGCATPRRCGGYQLPWRPDASRRVRAGGRRGRRLAARLGEERIGNVAIRVEDSPPAGSGLLGLYQGTPRPDRAGGDPIEPDRITIYRVRSCGPPRARTRSARRSASRCCTRSRTASASPRSACASSATGSAYSAGTSGSTGTNTCSADPGDEHDEAAHGAVGRVPCRVRRPARDVHETAQPHRDVTVDQPYGELAVRDVEGLVGVWVHVQGRRRMPGRGRRRAAPSTPGRSRRGRR